MIGRGRGDYLFIDLQCWTLVRFWNLKFTFWDIDKWIEQVINLWNMMVEIKLAN